MPSKKNSKKKQVIQERTVQERVELLGKLNKGKN